MESKRNNTSKIQGYQRPREAELEIDKAFAHLLSVQKENQCGYIFRGKPVYAINLYGLTVDSKKILDDSCKHLQNESSSITVLDIGAGDFHFAAGNQVTYGNKVVTYGIAANDIFRKAAQRQEDEFHVFNNAEYLSRIYGKNKFHYIFSSETFKHFVDPVGSLIEAYKTLKSGGVLVLDEFSIPGCENAIAHFIPYLQSQGYHVVASRCIGTEITNVVIQKTNEKPDLIFPVEFHHIENNKIHYKITPELQSYLTKNKNTSVQNYLESKIRVIDETNKIDDEILNQCPNVPSLLMNPLFKKLQPAQQNICLLAVVAKNTDFSAYRNLVDECVKFDSNWKINSTFTTIYNRIILNRHASGLDLLWFDSFFQTYENMSRKDAMQFSQQQVRIITLAAMEDLMRLNERVKIQKQLSEIGLPWDDLDKNKLGQDRSSFKFPFICKNLSDIDYDPLLYLGDGRKGNKEKPVESNRFNNIEIIVSYIPSMKDKLTYLQTLFEMIVQNKNHLYTHTGEYDTFNPKYTDTQIHHINQLQKMYFNIVIASESTKQIYSKLILEDSNNHKPFHLDHPGCLINFHPNVVGRFFNMKAEEGAKLLEIVNQYKSANKPDLSS